MRKPKFEGLRNLSEIMQLDAVRLGLEPRPWGKGRAEDSRERQSGEGCKDHKTVTEDTHCLPG